MSEKNKKRKRPERPDLHRHHQKIKKLEEDLKYLAVKVGENSKSVSKFKRLADGIRRLFK